MLDCDVAVVGAGPAGATLARCLAVSGVRTVILERSRLPRYKTCAGGIPLRTSRLLPFSIDSVVEDRINRIELTYRGSRGFVRRATSPFAQMVMRDRFDRLLTESAERAGAVLLDQTVVRGIDRTGSHFHLHSDRDSVRARLVVGADGANSVVARHLGLGSGLTAAVALEAEVAAPESALSRWRGAVNVDVGYRPAGYGWVFPKTRLLSVGLVHPNSASSRLRPALARYLARLGLAESSIERLTGHHVLLRQGGEVIAGDGVLLAGDAAGLVDEFTEEGIYYAIRSGEIAAQFLVRALGGSRQCLGGYQQAIDDQLLPELRAARMIAGLYYGALARAPRFTHELSGHVAHLWNAFFRVQRGDSSYARELRAARVIEPFGRVLVR